MKTRLLRRASAGALALTLIGATAAFADNIAADADNVDAAIQTTLNLGPIACNLPETVSIPVWLIRNGNYPNPQVFANSAPVSIIPNSSSPALTATSGTITLPSNWSTIGNNATSATFTSTATVVSGVEGPGSATLNYAGSGPGSGGGTTTRTLDPVLTISWTTGSCVTNSQPSAPTNVVATAVSPGGVIVSWDASTDPQDHAFTYTLEGKDSDDAAYTTIATGLTTTSYSFGPTDPAEGTWTFRVKAEETSTNPALSSGYGVSNAAIVDRTAPAAPVASPSRVAEYMDGSGVHWWKDGVDVSFIGNGDPSLADGSDGSSVSSTTAPSAITAPGPFSVSGTATDYAGNESVSTTFSGAVDGIDPGLSVTCPTTTVYFGDTAFATWSATDEGSGVKGATSGTLSIATSVTGDVVVGTIAEDNVGHTTSRTATCKVTAWTLNGFYQPVDMGTNVWNTVKGGSTVPLKFEAFAASELTDAAVVDNFTVKGVACPITGVTTDDIELVTTGGTTLRYDWTAGQFVQNWQTPKKPGACYTVTMKTDDGSTISANFKLK